MEMATYGREANNWEREQYYLWTKETQNPGMVILPLIPCYYWGWDGSSAADRAQKYHIKNKGLLIFKNDVDTILQSWWTARYYDNLARTGQMPLPKRSNVAIPCMTTRTAPFTRFPNVIQRNRPSNAPYAFTQK